MKKSELLVLLLDELEKRSYSPELVNHEFITYTKGILIATIYIYSLSVTLSYSDGELLTNATCSDLNTFKRWMNEFEDLQ